MRRCVLVLTVLLGFTALGGCGGKDNASDAVPAAAIAASGPSGATSVPSAPKGPPPVSATADVSRVAPALDSYFRTNGYPVTLEAVAQAMPRANLAMDPTNALAGYRLDALAKQFRLCVENDSGSWATYDTASMKVAGQGAAGGCPTL